MIAFYRDASISVFWREVLLASQQFAHFIFDKFEYKSLPHLPPIEERQAKPFSS